MRILVLDDNREFLRVLALNLQAEGFCVLAFFSAQEALGNIQAADVLLTDYHMPEMTGLGVARQAYARGWRGSLFIMSGRVPDIDEQLAHPLLCSVLHKPFSIRQLTEKLPKPD